MTFDDDVPIPEPRGDLVPPVRYPPTAVGADGPSPEPRPPAVLGSAIQDWQPLLAFVGHAVSVALDALDAAGDAVAQQLGLRPAAAEPPASPPPI